MKKRINFTKRQVKTKDIIRKINASLEILNKNPFYHPNIKKLKGELKKYYRFRSGNIRIIYQVDKKEKVVWIVAIGKRGKIYK